jgi:hypothetical protein
MRVEAPGASCVTGSEPWEKSREAAPVIETDKFRIVTLPRFETATWRVPPDRNRRVFGKRLGVATISLGSAVKGITL